MKPLLLIIALLFSTPAWADENDLARDQLLKDADYFAECSGVFTIASGLNESDSPASAKLQSDQARGALAASNYLAAKMGRKHFRTRTDAITETTITKWASTAELTPETFMDEFLNVMKACYENWRNAGA